MKPGVCWLCLVLATSSLRGRKESNGDAEGPLVLVGGNLQEENTEIWDMMVELSGGKGIARIGVVTAANENAEESGKYYVDMFIRYGAASVIWIPVMESDLGAAFDEDVVETVLDMDGIFFGGGEPSRIVQTLFTEDEHNVRNETPVLTAIKMAWLAGAMVAGTSAGIEAMQTNVMITGGQSWNALVYGALNTTGDPDNLTYDPLGGLGFVDGVVIDAHFSEKGREGRLARLVADTRMEENGAVRGLGLDEDTALVCRQGACQVMGSGGVWAVDLSTASVGETGGWWTCGQAMTHYLTLQDTLYLHTWRVTFADWKSDMAGQEQGEEAETSSKIFCGDQDQQSKEAEYNRVVNSLMQARALSTCGNTDKSDPVAYRVFFLKTDLSPAVTRGFSGTHPSTGDLVISYENLSVSFRPW